MLRNDGLALVAGGLAVLNEVLSLNAQEYTLIGLIRDNGDSSMKS